MKILVFSDSHGYIDHMTQAVELHNPDHILHLGDHLRDAESLAALFPHIPLDCVPGNCDFSLQEPLEKRLDFEGFSLLICHGHTLRVKESYQIARYTGLERGVGAVLFGHTHEAHCVREEDGLWVLNPGSCGYGGGSAGLIEIQNGRIVDCRILRG